MPEIVAFHFLLLAIGEILKHEGSVSAQKIQDFIREDETFGVRVPLEDCRLALQLMLNSGFILEDPANENKYIRNCKW